MSNTTHIYHNYGKIMDLLYNDKQVTRISRTAWTSSGLFLTIEKNPNLFENFKLEYYSESILCLRSTNFKVFSIFIPSYTDMNATDWYVF